MSKTISSSEQLENFLSKLVRDSLSDAQSAIQEGSVVIEQEEKSAESEDAEEDKEDIEVKVDVNDEKDPMERPPASERAPKRPETGADVKLSNILYDINQIRSGRSLRDPDVKGNLEDYFNRLTNPERIALSEFLQGLTDVIVKGVPGDDAEDPSDEVKMTEPEASSDTEEVEVESEEEVEEKVAEKPAEDTTPPIQVRR